MHRLLLLFILILFNKIVFSQSSEPESLKKYSYFIYGHNWQTDSSYLGTCFFVRNKHKMWIVTASHVVSGLDVINCKETPSWPDTMFVAISDQYKLPLDVTQEKKRECLTMYQKPDLYFHKLSKDEMKKCKDVYSIEKYILPDTIIGNYQREIYGYNDFGPIKGGEVYYGSYPYRTATLKKDGIPFQDSLNFSVTISNKDIGEGFSGAPLFFISDFKKGNKARISVLFAGVCVGGNPENNIAVIVKPYFVRRELNLR